MKGTAKLFKIEIKDSFYFFFCVNLHDKKPFQEDNYKKTFTFEISTKIRGFFKKKTFVYSILFN